MQEAPLKSQEKAQPAEAVKKEKNKGRKIKIFRRPAKPKKKTEKSKSKKKNEQTKLKSPKKVSKK